MRALLLWLGLAGLFVPPSAIAESPPGVSVLDQGWRMVHRGDTVMLEMKALVVNRGSRSTECDVCFTVERRRQLAQPRGSASPGGGKEEWEKVHTATVKAGLLAPGTSAAVATQVSYGILAPGASHRFRVEALDPVTGALWSSAVISKQVAPLLPALGLGALAAQESSGIGASAALQGAGTMVGQHEAHRVAGEWVETGSGSMTLDSVQGRIVLEYTYTFRGPSDMSLTAMATATGQLISPFSPPVPIAVTSATAQVIYAGTRRQLGPTVRRDGGAATGVFAALVGRRSCRGVLTLSNGTQTLDPATGRGDHRFDVRFSEAVGERVVAPPKIPVAR